MLNGFEVAYIVAAGLRLGTNAVALVGLNAGYAIFYC